MIGVLIVLVRVLLVVAFLTLFERVVLAHIHRRSGPNLVGFQGVGQSIGDVVKLLSKEYLCRILASFSIFVLCRILTCLISLLNWSVLPFFESVILSDVELGVIFVLILAMLSVYGVLMSGWSSNSKYALLGSLRSTAQMLGYDVTVTLVWFSLVLVSGSLNFVVLVVFQGSYYLGLVYPLVLIGAIINGLAEVNRVPFDLREAEPELVSGYNTEYSGVGFTLFFLSEYTSIYATAVILTCLFLGGWW
jgi:NADH-quinone oxidoreductase subunit H